MLIVLPYNDNLTKYVIAFEIFGIHFSACLVIKEGNNELFQILTRY